jgi:hypothetical protein
MIGPDVMRLPSRNLHNFTHFLLVIGQDHVMSLRLPFRQMCNVTHHTLIVVRQHVMSLLLFRKICNVTHQLLVIGLRCVIATLQNKSQVTHILSVMQCTLMNIILKTIQLTLLEYQGIGYPEECITNLLLAMR